MIKAARAQAAAAATDADSVAKTASTYITTSETQAASSSDFAATTAAAPFAQHAVTLANLADAFSQQAANETDDTKAADDATNAQVAADEAHKALQEYLDKRYANTKVGCKVNGLDSQGKPTYGFNTWLPLVGKGCNDQAVISYYSVSRTLTVANQVQYLYSAAQSTNEVNADLLTSTFSGGVQVVLAGTATAGSSQPATTGAGSATTSTAGTTDSVATAVSKLEQGGDFNLRLAYPLANYVGSNGGFSLTASPNLGFTVNGLSGQNTITESTEYLGNLPIEFYGQVGSIPHLGTPALFFVDAKVSGEFLTSDLAAKLGSPKNFFLGQFAAGIEFAQNVRVGFQYYLGPSQAYCAAATSGCTAVTSSMSGVHLAVSFNPTPAAK